MITFLTVLPSIGVFLHLPRWLFVFPASCAFWFVSGVYGLCFDLLSLIFYCCSRQAIVNATVNSLVQFRKQTSAGGGGGGLLVPSTLSLLPLHTLAMMKLVRWSK